jgi:glycosyltransferase involved in cell wall biosynthesis
MIKVSIIIPAFNEKDTILSALERIEAINLEDIEKEIIIVDDGSTDGIQEVLKDLENKYQIIYHPKNQGKGMAIRNGFAKAQGEIVLIQDADLECDPRNYPALIQPILDGKADVVFGSRFKSGTFRHFSYLFYLGNKFLTGVSNLITGLNITDMWTGYKVFRIKIIQEMLPYLRAERFEIEPELTVMVSKGKYRFLEVPLKFLGHPRTPEQGKKMNWKVGFFALWFMLKYKLFR